MAYDLLNEAWLPVRRRSGAMGRVSLSQIVSQPADPIVDVAAPRPDLRAAGVTLLVGLLQTLIEPGTEDAWAEMFRQPPSSAVLAKALEGGRGAFDLREADHPFMQERGLEGDVFPIQNLLFGTPTGQTLAHNKDFFIKRAPDGAFCPPCATLALYALQSFAQKGGRGYRVSLRGGGPLSAMLVGETLWETLWLNVLPRDAWLKDHSRVLDASCWPWLSDEQGPTSLASISAGHHYWGMPRRVEFVWEEEEGACTLCGVESRIAVTGFRRRPGGIEYQGSWVHPLSPTYELDGVRSCVKGERDPAGYRHWHGLVVENWEDKRRPSPVLLHLMTTRASALGQYDGWRVWVHGMETEDMSVLGWYENVIPQLQIPHEKGRAEYEQNIARLVAGSSTAARYLYGAVKAACEPASPPKNLDTEFWRETESAFHKALHDLLHATDARSVRRRWRDVIEKQALLAFRRALPVARIAEGRAARIAGAEHQLGRSLRGPKMCRTLEIEHE